MDSVTQQNAASAEASASATEALSTQAETIQQAVQQLTALVGDGGPSVAKKRGKARSKPSDQRLRVTKFSVSDETFHQMAQPGPKRSVSPVGTVASADAFNRFNDQA